MLIDPALGEAFDAARNRIESPVATASALAAGVFDMVRDRVGLRRFGMLGHLRVLGGRSLNTVAHPGVFFATATAIVQAELSSRVLGQLRENGVPVAVLHGERDMIVPLESAINVAQQSNGTLVTPPNAYHSWVLPSPWTFVQILEHLLAGGHLGVKLRSECGEARRKGMDAAMRARYLDDGAALLGLMPPVRVIGKALPRKDSYYHAYRICEPPQQT